jgi:hypothetical protein
VLHKTTKLRRAITVSALAITIAVGAVACDAIPEITSLRDRAAVAHTEIESEITSLEQARRDLAPGSPRAAATEAALAAASQRAASVQALVSQLDTLLDEAENPTDTLSGAAHALSPLIPEPARGPLLLAAGLGVALWRAGQLKRSAVSIVNGFEEAMRRDPAMREKIQGHADLFRASQTPTAKRIVDEVTKPDRGMLRLPV